MEDARGVLTADHIEEIILQTYLFAGFPRTINAFFTWQRWAAQPENSRGHRVTERCDEALWRERGEDLCRLIYGQNFEALQRRLTRLHPELAEWTLVEGYGKVLSRDGPGPKARELAAVGALIAVDAERQLIAHLKGALHAGVQEDVLRRAALEIAAEWGRGQLVERLLDEAGI